MNMPHTTFIIIRTISIPKVGSVAFVNMPHTTFTIIRTISVPTVGSVAFVTLFVASSRRVLKLIGTLVHAGIALTFRESRETFTNYNRKKKEK
jgi:hypothetical protein